MCVSMRSLFVQPLGARGDARAGAAGAAGSAELSGQLQRAARQQRQDLSIPFHFSDPPPYPSHSGGGGAQTTAFVSGPIDTC